MRQLEWAHSRIARVVIIAVDGIETVEASPTVLERRILYAKIFSSHRIVAQHC